MIPRQTGKIILHRTIPTWAYTVPAERAGDARSALCYIDII